MRFIAFSLLVILLFSCKGKDARNSNATEAKTVNSSTKTQALILTQPFDYNASSKNKVTDEYISNTRLVVPDNLAPQNKWFMFEGPVLENDLVAYRYYADSRHRFDIYGKRVNDLVMDTVSWDYHKIMNWGSDILKVGNSLGLGSPAIYYQDSIYTLSNYVRKEITVINSGDQQSSIRTTFTGFKIEEYEFDLIQDWSIEAGNPSSNIKLQLLNATLPKDMYFATGIVKHIPDIITDTNDSAFYAANWGPQTFHGENMGMAIISTKNYKPKIINNELNHLVVFQANNSEVIYSFVSVWERDLNNVRTKEDFIELVNDIKSSK